ncbi:MAG TPA: hypothetical protein VF607_09230, partial [Verrucomicrobiae bacterium]
ATPTLTIPLPVGPSGEVASVTSQISYGFFAGFGLEYLYQYRVNVGAASPVPVNGFNLWSGGAGLGAGAAILAATGQPPGGGAGAAANLWAASAPDLANPALRQAPGGVTIPPTPVAAPFANAAFNALVASVTSSLGAGGYVFLTPPGNLNQSVNFNSPGWDFTAWSDGAGSSLVRWFSAGGVAPGNSSPVFSVLSPFGPVPAGAFPDPPDTGSVNISIDDVLGESTYASDPQGAGELTPVPEPGFWGAGAALVLGCWAFLRRRLASK